MSTNVTKQNIDARWQDLQQAIEGIPEDRMNETGVCGVWSVKDLLGHIAFWDDHSVQDLEAKATETPVEALQPADYQAMNDQSAAERSSWSLDQVRQEFDAAHERRLTAYAKYPDLAAEVWGSDDAGSHYNEHAAQIREWRQQQGV